MNKEDLLKLSYDELYDMYEDLSDIKEKKLIQSVVEELASKDKNIYDESFQSYPEYYNNHLQDIILNKQEFNPNQLMLDTDIEDACISDFSIKGHQSFLKNFITRESPYKSILIYHGVGVGKTCSGVTIAENFRDPYARKDRRILILSSKNIQIGWKKTIFTPSKGVDQCTGDTFSLPSGESAQQREVNKMIKQYYELMAYQSFSNYVTKLIAKEKVNLSETEKDKAAEICIKKYFSNRLMIIDEVHNIRDEQSNDMRDAVKTIEMVIKYSDNLRLVLLTATPMYNRATEIIWILNMMLLNDKRPLIDKKSVFTNEGELTEEGKQLIKDKSRSYISYLRGENPITFPLRIYPSMVGYDNYTKLKKYSVLHKSFYPKLNIVGGKIKDKFQFLELFGSRLQGFQEKVYQKVIQDLINDNPDMDLDIRGEKTSITDVISLTQMSTIIYPSTKKIENISEIVADDYVGERGLSKCMNKKGNRYSYKPEIIKTFGPFFDKDHIHNFSSKLSCLLTILDKSEGIVFIYTNSIQSGIIPLSLCLEQNGYKRFKGSPTLQYSKKRPFRKISESNYENYMVIDGSTTKKDLEEQLKIVNSKENKHGEKIKIILGTVVASEGLDFKRIRSIHILDPWVHLNRLEQTIGRGIRFCSHADLPNESKNVLIFLHCATLQDDKESVDTHIYRYAERKSIQIGEVETILKKTAVDRYLYKDVNVIHKGDLHPIKMKSCIKGSTNILMDLYDKPYSKICSWGICDFNNNLKNPRIIDLNDDTYFEKYSSPIIQNLKKKISKLYRNYLVYDIKSILGLIYEEGYFLDELIYIALHEMITQKTIIYDKHGNSGYLINRDMYYIYQPFLIDDETIPLYYRNNLTEYRETYVLLPKIKDIVDVCSVSSEYDDSMVFNIYDSMIGMLSPEQVELINLLSVTYEKFKDISIDHPIVYELLFDNLKFNDKCAILYSNLKPHTISHELSDIFRNIVSSLIYYKQNDTYYFNNSSKNGTVSGFVLSYNGEPCFIDYYNLKLKKCNSVQLLGIQQSIQQYKNTSHHKEFCKTPKYWGYNIYSKKDKDSVFKLVTSKPNQSTKYPGIVCKDTNQDVSVSKLEQILSELVGDITPITQYLVEKEQDYKDRGQKMKKKTYLCFLLELIFRINKSFYNYDKIWLKYI